MVNPSNRIEERAAHYSFNVESVLYNQLPMELQTLWKQEIEQAYRAGATDMLEKPTGGGLLHVCCKSSARGRRDAIDDVTKHIGEYITSTLPYGKSFCKKLIDEIQKFRELK